jgi:hypothetical protein
VFHVITYFIKGDEGFGTSCSRRLLRYVPNLTYAYSSPTAYSSQTMYPEERAFVPQLFQSQYGLLKLDDTLFMKVVFFDPQVSGQEPFLKGGSDPLRDTSPFNIINEPLYFPSLHRFLKQRIVISPIECIKYSLHFRSDSSQYGVGFFLYRCLQNQIILFYTTSVW